MRINIEAAYLLSYFFGEHYQDLNNIKINMKKFTHPEVPHLFYSIKCKVYCTVLPILFYICCDKVRLWLFFHFSSYSQYQIFHSGDLNYIWQNYFLQLCMPVLAQREIHLNEEVFELVIAIKIQRRKIKLYVTLLWKHYDVKREGQKAK